MFRHRIPHYQLAISLVFTTAQILPNVSSLASPNSRWADLHSTIVPSEPPPLCVDLTLHPPRDDDIHSSDANNIPVLIRERHGWCHFSSRVWLALELRAGGSRYNTYLLESRGDTYDGADDDDVSYQRPDFLEGLTLPRLKLPGSNEWLGADTEEDLLQLLQTLDAAYDDNDNPPLFPCDRVRELAKAFADCAPAARESRRAAWLFSAEEGYRLDALPESTFVGVLDRAEGLLASTDGPFFVGSSITAADIVWTPLLERYAAQLPCLHCGLSPRGDLNERWPRLQQWYKAMDTAPIYTGRIRGDAPSWRKVLYSDPWWPRADLWHPRDTVGPKGELQATEEECIEAFGGISTEGESSVWSAYASTRPHVASTARKEAASVLVRNHKAILPDVANWLYEEGYDKIPEEDLDSALRQIAVLLSSNGTVDEVSKNVAMLLTYLDARLCVPRDMGYLPATCIRKLLQTLTVNQNG